MSALAENVRRAVGRGRAHDTAARLDGLARAVQAAQGRLPDEVVAPARQALERAGQRLRLSGDHTVVALAGATGSGKSTLFNRLCGLELAATGVRRPTTSWTMACTWGTDGAGELLDWVGVPRRHQVSRGSLLDTSDPQQDMHGLVLLDLPDHDSTEVSHHVEVDRVVQAADLLVWVLDPQKYADAAVHERYLRPLSAHADVMLVVVNHIDEVPSGQRDVLLSDVRRVLREDGLGAVRVLATSATGGEGVAELRQRLLREVQRKHAARGRVAADVETAAARLDAATGAARPRDVDRASTAALVDAFADAAGVPTVVDAVARSTRTRARQATGWPPTRWLARLRPDPLRRLHLDRGTVAGGDRTGSSGGAGGAASVVRTSLPQPTQVQRARVDTAVRAAVTEATDSMPHLWAAAVRRASVSRLDDIADALDRAVGETDLGAHRRPRWWRVVRWLQWLLLAAAVAGGAWLAALFGLAYLRVPEPPTPDWHGVPLPTLLLLGGVLAGFLLALLSRLLAAVSARRRAAAADRRLRAAIHAVVDDLVAGPVRAELDAYRACRDGVAAARGR